MTETKKRRAAQSRWVPTAEAAAREIRREKRRRYRRHRRRVFAAILLLALAAGWLIATQVFELATVRGTGMSPTLETGSVVVCLRQGLLDRLAGIVPEERRRVGRGELVLLDYVQEDEGGGEARARMIKRVVGMGGDTIDMVDGVLVVNGEPLMYAGSPGDRVYPITVPVNRLFVMGDHPEVSVDSRSRVFGAVPESDVAGRPLVVIWPVYAIGIPR